MSLSSAAPSGRGRAQKETATCGWTAVTVVSEGAGRVSLAGGHGSASGRRPGTATPQDTFQQPGCVENGVRLCSVIPDLQCWRFDVEGLFPLGIKRHQKPSVPPVMLAINPGCIYRRFVFQDG